MGALAHLRSVQGLQYTRLACSGGTKRATSVNDVSEGKFTMSGEIEPVRRSCCRQGSCTLYGNGCRSLSLSLCIYVYVYIYIYIYIYIERERERN